MKSTFITETGTRICVEPSPNFGNVRIWIKGTDQIVAIPAELAAVVAQGIEAAARDLLSGDALNNHMQATANAAALAAARQFGSCLRAVP